MKKILFGTLLLSATSGISQVKIDIEVQGGKLINGKSHNLNLWDNESNLLTEFRLRNGLFYGLGFDIHLKNSWRLSFGFNHGESFAMAKQEYRLEGTPGLTPSVAAFGSPMNIGELTDRVFFLGLKRNISLAEGSSIEPFLGIYQNFFSYVSFDHELRLDWEGFPIQEEALQIRTTANAGFDTRESTPLGANGIMFGIGFSQMLNNIGTLTLSASYAVDLMNSVSQSFTSNGQIFSFNTSESENFTTGIEQNRARNMVQIKVGFKMPCSILLGKDKK